MIWIPETMGMRRFMIIPTDWSFLNDVEHPFKNKKSLRKSNNISKKVFYKRKTFSEKRGRVLTKENKR